MRPPNPTPDEDAPLRYVVRESGQYEMDLDAAFLRRLSQDADFAGRWLKRLSEVLADLPDFPGPLSHAIDEEASAVYGYEVRRLLYYGPTRKRTGTPVRILFTILPPDFNDPPQTAESVILLLRLLHGPQTLFPDEEAEDAT